jgi:hypothetical protein
LLGTIGLVGFGVSLVVHVLTIFDIDVSSRFPYVWIMVPAVLPYAIYFVFSIRAKVGARLTFDALQDNLPGRVVLVIGAALVYSFANDVLCLYLISPGSGDIINGEYVLTSHGKIMAHVTEAQYHLHRAYELRLFSGGWLLFWLLPLSYFLFWKHVPIRSTDCLLAWDGDAEI